MARRSINYIPSAATPIQSGAATLQAWAAANAGMADKIGDVGDALTTGVEDWSKFNEAKVKNYLKQFPDDISRRNALSELMDYEKQEETGGSQIGRFTNIANIDLDAMQLRDMKVAERAEQQRKAEDVHLKAAHELTQAGLMDPKKLLHKDATIEGVEAVTGKVLEETGGIGVDQRRKARELDSKILYETAQTEKMQQATKTAKQTYDVKQKVIDDTKIVSGQFQKILDMPLIAEPNPEFGDETAEQQEWLNTENTRLNFAQLDAVTKQIQANNAAGIYDKNTRLKEVTRKHLTQSGYGISDAQFKEAGITQFFTPESHEALIQGIVTDLARTYPTNTQAELRAHAKKIISADPNNLATHFRWGAELVNEKYPERKARLLAKVMNKQLKQLQNAPSLAGKLKLIAEFKKMNISGAMSPEEMTRFNQVTAPLIEEFAGSIDANNLLLNNLPQAVKDDPAFQKNLILNQSRHGLAGAIRLMDIRKFTPTLQRQLYKNIRKSITDKMGPMLKSELTPLVNLVMGENPAITYQFGENKKVVDFQHAMTDIKTQLQKDTLKLDSKAILGFKDNSTLAETIISNVITKATVTGDETDINARQLKYSVETTISTIKDALGVGPGWTQSNKNALNIAIGAFLSGVRVDWDIQGNDYTLPHIAFEKDISKLNPNQLIEGLKEHLEFAASKVQNADMFETAVSTYVKKNPYEPSFIQMILQKSPIGQLTGVYHGEDIGGSRP